jgi:hypothetical protein
VIRNRHCVLRIAHNDVRLAVDLLSGEKYERMLSARRLYTPGKAKVSAPSMRKLESDHARKEEAERAAGDPR